jgi:hypothetical protein
MGRHHDRKYGITPLGAAPAPGKHRSFRHITHQHRQRHHMKRMAKIQPVSYGMMGFNRLALGLGVLGLVGAGILGYTLFHRKSLGTSTFGWRSFLPFRSKVLPITAPIASTAGFVNGRRGLKSSIVGTGLPVTAGKRRISPTMKERMGFTGHYPTLGIMGFIKSLKNTALYGTPYMIKEPVYPVNAFRQVL